MDNPISDIAFTPSVKAAQEQMGSREIYASMEQKGGWNDVITADLAEFVAQRDTFFLATVNADGQPYIQHRGGPPGFLKVLDDHTLGFADFKGNLQYISVGNLEDNSKAFIFLMDFANRRRIKIWGTARVAGIEENAELLEKLTDEDYSAKVERIFLFEVKAWDINCPQHIVPRFTEQEVEEMTRPLHEHIEELEAKVRTCCPDEAPVK